MFFWLTSAHSFADEPSSHTNCSGPEIATSSIAEVQSSGIVASSSLNLYLHVLPSTDSISRHVSPGPEPANSGPRVTHYLDYDPEGIAAVEEFHRYGGRGTVLIELSQTDVDIVLDHLGDMVSTEVRWNVYIEIDEECGRVEECEVDEAFDPADIISSNRHASFDIIEDDISFEEWYPAFQLDKTASDGLETRVYEEDDRYPDRPTIAETTSLYAIQDTDSTFDVTAITTSASLNALDELTRCNSSHEQRRIDPSLALDLDVTLVACERDTSKSALRKLTNGHALCSDVTRTFQWKKPPRFGALGLMWDTECLARVDKELLPVARLEPSGKSKPVAVDQPEGVCVSQSAHPVDSVAEAQSVVEDDACQSAYNLLMLVFYWTYTARCCSTHAGLESASLPTPVRTPRVSRRKKRWLRLEREKVMAMAASQSELDAPLSESSLPGTYYPRL